MRLAEVVDKWYKINDGSRTLLESVVVPEVGQAVKDWIANAKPDFVLVGGLALAYHHIPRMTMDVDVLYISRDAKPSAEEVHGFKQQRAHMFQHKKTHVEIETLTPEFLNLPQQLVDAVFDTALQVGNVKIASKSGLVALKLAAKRTGAKGLQDQADIINLISLGGIDLSPFDLTDDQKKQFEFLSREALT